MARDGPIPQRPKMGFFTIIMSMTCFASSSRLRAQMKQERAVSTLQANSTGSRRVTTCTGDMRSPYTCDQDSTHRVCATLIEDPAACTPKQWGASGDFWKITGQSSWASEVCGEPNAGTGWCICKWAFATLINEVGCSSVEFSCDATDVTDVCSSYSDGSVELSSAHDCIKERCAGHTLGGHCA